MTDDFDVINIDAVAIKECQAPRGRVDENDVLDRDILGVVKAHVALCVIFVAMLADSLLKAAVNNAAAEDANVLGFCGHERAENECLGVNVDRVVVAEVDVSGEVDAGAVVKGQHN